MMEVPTLTVVCHEGRPPADDIFAYPGCPQPVSSRSPCPGPGPAEETRVPARAGRPLEALGCYEQALAIDPDFGMALGNKAMAIQTLASVTRYPVTHLIQAHQLYQAAIARSHSVAEVGLDGSLESFRSHDDEIVRYLTTIGRADRLDQDLRHEPYDDSALSDFVRFYTRFCLQHDLYLNTHLLTVRQKLRSATRSCRNW